jgi:hypothetical protein
MGPRVGLDITVQDKPVYPVFEKTLTVSFIKPGLEGEWLGSFYVITDVIDKESY